MRYSVTAHFAQPAGSITAAAQGKKHARGKIKVRVHTGKSGREHNEIHDGGCVWYVRRSECGYKRAAGKRGRTALVPRNHGNHDRDGKNVEENEAVNDVPHGPRSRQ